MDRVSIPLADIVVQAFTPLDAIGNYNFVRFAPEAYHSFWRKHIEPVHSDPDYPFKIPIDGEDRRNPRGDRQQYLSFQFVSRWQQGEYRVEEVPDVPYWALFHGYCDTLLLTEHEGRVYAFLVQVSTTESTLQSFSPGTYSFPGGALDGDY